MTDENNSISDNPPAKEPAKDGVTNHVEVKVVEPNQIEKEMLRQQELTKNVSLVSALDRSRFQFKAGKYNAPNKKCHCGSGKKYKKCCGAQGL